MADMNLVLTPSAQARVRRLIAGPGAGARGLRIGVASTGCSGLTYAMEFAHDVADGEFVVEQGDVTVIVPESAAPYLAGTVVDWVENKLDSKFTFENPNEAARCGCGESFTV